MKIMSKKMELTPKKNLTILKPSPWPPQKSQTPVSMPATHMSRTY